MKFTTIIIGLLFSIQSIDANPIDVVTKDLNDRINFWMNGYSASPDLPEDAKLEDLLEAFFTNVSYDKGRVESFKIIEKKSIYIGEKVARNNYQAAFIKTNVADLVIIYKYIQDESVGKFMHMETKLPREGEFLTWEPPNPSRWDMKSYIP